MTFLLAAFTAHQVFIPASHPAQLGVGTAPEQRRIHHPDDFPEEFVLAVQAPFDLGDHGVRQAQFLQGVVEGLSSMLGLAAITSEAFSSGAAPAMFRFGLSFMILSGAAGMHRPLAHGMLLLLPR